MKNRFETFRRDLHRDICGTIASIKELKDGRAVYNVADHSSQVSVVLAAGMMERIGHACRKESAVGQTAGSEFVRLIREFLEKAFSELGHLRPGPWRFPVRNISIGYFEQYAHLSELAKILKEHPRLKTALGGDYLVTPDIVVVRERLTDEQINAGKRLVGTGTVASLTSLRRRDDGAGDLLHASISCKWTIRSDRSQNTRTEALNLIRNRKGKTPHIIAVTMEPLPSRIASIALGTGDIDCTYHVALHELLDSAKNSPYPDSLELLETLVEGRRLRDISDLPLDLAI